MGKWYIIHTRPRWEKKVFNVLKTNGFEAYCPVKKVERKWSDRFKTIEEPLFSSYIFVKIAPEEKTKVRMTEGVINFVHHNGKLVSVKAKEISSLKSYLLNNATTEVVLHLNVPFNVIQYQLPVVTTPAEGFTSWHAPQVQHSQPVII